MVSGNYLISSTIHGINITNYNICCICPTPLSLVYVCRGDNCRFRVSIACDAFSKQVFFFSFKEVHWVDYVFSVCLLNAICN